MNKKNQANRVSFGILCDSWKFQAWQAEAIRLLRNNGFEASIVLMNLREPKTKPKIRKLRKYPYHKIIYRIYQRYLMKPKAKELLDLQKELSDIPLLKVMPERRKSGYYINEEMRHKIAEHNPSFLLRFGFGILRGEILSTAEYGIWSFHHDDDKKYRGVPSNFWEIYYSDPVNASILQVLNEEIDGGGILRKGFFPTVLHSWKENLDQAYFQSAIWPLQAAQDVQNGIIDPKSLKGDPENSPVYRLPENTKMLRFFCSQFTNRIKLHWREVFQAEDWRIGIFQCNDITKKDTVRLQDLITPPPPAKNTYYADPFILKKDNELHVLFEEYDYKSGKGQISGHIYNIGTQIWSAKKCLLQKNTHLAYPFSFVHEGQIYCLPENAADNRLELYTYDAEVQELQLKSVLIEGLACIDASLIHYDEKWWLFFTAQGKTNHELHIYYADNLEGPYRPHENNPVKQDIRHARPGGNFIKINDRWLRPAQDSTDSYGCRLHLMEIAELSTKNYREQRIASLKPGDDKNFFRGLHTLSKAGNYYITDLKAWRFNRPNFIRKLKEKLHF